MWDASLIKVNMYKERGGGTGKRKIPGIARPLQWMCPLSLLMCTVHMVCVHVCGCIAYVCYQWMKVYACLIYLGTMKVWHKISLSLFFFTCQIQGESVPKRTQNEERHQGTKQKCAYNITNVREGMRQGSNGKKTIPSMIYYPHCILQKNWGERTLGTGGIHWLTCTSIKQSHFMKVWSAMLQKVHPPEALRTGPKWKLTRSKCFNWGWLPLSFRLYV